MKKDTVEKYIRFTLIPDFGILSQNRLLEMCGNIDNCFILSLEDFLCMNKNADKNTRISRERIEKFVNFRESQEIIEKTQMVIEDCKSKGIEIITKDSNKYPNRFGGLTDMPLVLYVKGNLKINEYNRSIGVVGARRCSREGKATSIEATENELKNGSAIISGMAKGIDSYAHTAAIINKGYTIAVLGNGPDVCYPKEHDKLYEMVVENGCVLSEYLPGTTPRNYMFPKRNRLIAALSDVLYVVDIGTHSGTETTVEACRTYKRKIIRLRAGI